MAKKNRTLYDLYTNLEAELSWRMKELRTYKLNIKGSTDETFYKSSIVMSYSHWEGYVKQGGYHYLNYVSLLKLKMKRLDSRYSALWVRKEMDNYLKIKSNVKRSHMLNLIRGKENGRASLPYKDVIDTNSNLNWEYFEDIAFLTCVPIDSYETKKKWLDDVLLKKRNFLAHGERYKVSKNDAVEIVETVIQLIENFKDDLYNSAQRELYLRR